MSLIIISINEVPGGLLRVTNSPEYFLRDFS